MNETHITGISGPLSATATSARDEAWHLMMNGGGIYDHYSYNWGNQNPVDNNAESEAARSQLGYLARFVNTLPLASMRRSMPVASTLWVNMPVAAYPPLSTPSDLVGCDSSGYCWAAMEEPKTKVLYIHRSALSASGGFPEIRAADAIVLDELSHQLLHDLPVELLCRVGHHATDATTAVAEESGHLRGLLHWRVVHADRNLQGRGWKPDSDPGEELFLQLGSLPDLPAPDSAMLWP